MKRLHTLAGSLIAVFIVAHLLNHLSAWWGESVHLATMEQLRRVYRHPIVEGLLLAAVLLQVVSGLRLCWQHRGLARARGSHPPNISNWRRLQWWSGLYMAFFLVNHLGAIMVGRHLLELDTNLYFGAAGLNSFPAILFFGPYYSLGILAFFAHLSAIYQQKMYCNLLGLSPKTQASLLLGIGGLVTLWVMAALTGQFKGLALPAAYQF